MIRVSRVFGHLSVAFLVVACISKVDADPSTRLTNPNDPSESVNTTPTIAALCGTICDALIQDYSVPRDLRDACIFECANGFDRAPDACYELVACVADRSLCAANDISPQCLARAGDCLPHWSLANGSCRGCWQPSRTVHGKQIVRYLSEGDNPVDPRPEDFSGMEIGALLPRANGDPYRFPGSGAADGTYAIKSVPGCGVWIQVGTTYTWSGNADVDTSYDYPGRRNPTLGAPGTQYQLHVQNITPWTQEDWLEGFVPQLGYFDGGFFGFAPPYDPADPRANTGDTEAFVFPPMGGQALIDPGQKDVLYLVQLSAQPQANGVIVRTAKRAKRIADFAPVSGMPTAYEAILDVVPETMSARIEFKRTTFEALEGEMNPKSARGAVPPGVFGGSLGLGAVDIWTHPARPRVGATGELVLIDGDSVVGDLPAVNVSFGTPYPSSFGIDMAVSVGWYVLLTDRTGAQYWGREMINQVNPFDRHDNSAPLVARVSPPKNIKIDGRSAFEARDGATLSLTPTLTWDTPTLGEPERYEIEVHEMSGRTTDLIQGKRVASFVIPRFPGKNEPALHTMTIPPGVLKRGSDYYFAVSSTFRKLDERTDDAIVVTAEYRP